jgi:hypothetical protein
MGCSAFLIQAWTATYRVDDDDDNGDGGDELLIQPTYRRERCLHQEEEEETRRIDKEHFTVKRSIDAAHSKVECLQSQQRPPSHTHTHTDTQTPSFNETQSVDD